jgi:hypothetical protein
MSIAKFGHPIEETQMPPPPPFAWELQTEQVFFQHAEGSFCLKYIVIRPKDMGFFYAFHSSSAPYPYAIATSCFEQTSELLEQESRSLTSRVESLGLLGEYAIGIVHIAWIDRPGQVINLQIFPSQNGKLLGELTPLRQLHYPTYQGGGKRGDIGLTQTAFPEILFQGPVKREQVAFFRRVLQQQPVSDMPHMFLQMPRGYDEVTVSLISQSDYLAVAGIENFR